MNCLVLGAGVSGLSAAKLLKQKGHKVSISDSKPLSPELTEQLRQWQIVPLPNQDKSILTGIDRIVLSPGIPPTMPILKEAAKLSIEVISEVDLALEFFSGTIIAVTGTNGKSTTCKMIEHIMRRQSLEAVACGNIGVPPSERIHQHCQDDYWVMELSSYQLEISKQIDSRVAIFTSFSEDHLARHKSMESYFLAKWRVFHKGDQTKIMSPEAYSYAEKMLIHNQFTNLKVIQKPLALDYSSLPFVTKHDRLNASFAVLAAKQFVKKDQQILLDSLKDFKTLPHRYEQLITPKGFNIINDSKATNLDSVMRALESTLDPCILMLGGQPKGESFEKLKSYKGKINQVICFGESGDNINQELSPYYACVTSPKLSDALSYLESHPDLFECTILFAPGCASFDEFKSFEERGEFFKSGIQRILSFGA